jgi:predicted site-specific integrase-resolvase
VVSESEVNKLLAGERYYEPIEIATICNYKRATIQRKCREGKIAATRINGIWKITKEEVKRFVQYGDRVGSDIADNG